jgi:hypothetical protein
VLTIAVLGARADVAAQMTNGWFVARATAALAIVAAAAIVAFLTAVPGVEPSRFARALPWAAGLSWGVMLAGAIAATRSPLALLLQAAPHPSCVLIIAAAAVSPWLMLVRMLRRGAALHAARTAAYAGAASLGVGALAAQFVCTNDAAAHHLLWHFTPVVLLTAASIVTGSVFLERPSAGRTLHRT